MVRVDQRKEINRMKKRVTTLLLTGVLMVMSSVPAMAAARIAVGPCPKCGVQACSTTTSTGYEHDELFACKHGKSGYDRYRVYKTVTRKIAPIVVIHLPVRRRKHINFINVRVNKRSKG